MKVFVSDHKVNIEELNQKNDGYEYEEMSLEDYINSLDTVEERREAYKKFGMAINIHLMVSSETIDHVKRVLSDVKTDPRLSKLNAVVMLGLKQQGRGVKFEPVSREQYKGLVEFCLDNGVPFGFDSCSAPAFIDAVKDHENYNQFKMMAEDCESTLFSSYIGVDGCFYPCSFTEGNASWKEGISVLDSENFIRDVWNHERTIEFRRNLIDNEDSNKCRNCPVHCVNGIDMRVGEFAPTQVGDII